MGCSIRQGDVLAPSVFCLFIDDLINEIKSLNCGIDMEGVDISVLVFTDDIALVASDMEKLQEMTNKLEHWCSHWKTTVNTSKTKLMHFRT